MESKIAHPDLGKIVLGAIVFMGYYAITFVAMFHEIPDKSNPMVMAAISTLGPIVGMIAMSVWPKGNDTDKKTIQNLSEKVNPVTVPVEKITPKEELTNVNG